MLTWVSCTMDPFLPTCIGWVVGSPPASPPSPAPVLVGQTCAGVPVAQGRLSPCLPDSNREDFDPAPVKSKFDSLDFDTLLRQAQRSLRR